MRRGFLPLQGLLDSHITFSTIRGEWNGWQGTANTGRCQVRTAVGCSASAVRGLSLPLVGRVRPPGSCLRQARGQAPAGGGGGSGNASHASVSRPCSSTVSITCRDNSPPPVGFADTLPTRGRETPRTTGVFALQMCEYRSPCGEGSGVGVNLKRLPWLPYRLATPCDTAPSSPVEP